MRALRMRGVAAAAVVALLIAGLYLALAGNHVSEDPYLLLLPAGTTEVCVGDEGACVKYTAVSDCLGLTLHIEYWNTSGTVSASADDNDGSVEICVPADVSDSFTIYAALLDEFGWVLTSQTATLYVVEVLAVTADKSTVCYGDDVTFTVTTSPADCTSQVQWSGGGSPSTQLGGGTFTTRFFSTGSHTVSATCGTTKQATVTVIGIASVTASEAEVCANSDVTFTVTTNPAGYENMVTWSGGGTPPGAVGGKTFTTHWSTGGTHTVMATCCTSSKSASVTVVDVVGVAADKDRVCRGCPVKFTVTTNPAGKYDLIEWSGGGDPASASGTGTFSTHWDTAGTYTVKAKCCTDEASATVTVVEVADVVKQGTTDGTATICVGDSITVEAVPNPAGAWPTGQPVWTLEQPEGSTLGDPADGTGTTSITPKVPGTYVLTATCCDSSDSFTLTAVALDKVVEQGTENVKATVCVGSSITLEAIPSPADASWPTGQPTWSIPTKPPGSSVSAPSPGATASVTPDVAGSYTIKATCGCGSCSGPSNATFDLTAVDVAKLQYENAQGQYVDIPTPFRVRVGDSVKFKAVITPEGADWPSGQPTWSGEASGTGETTTVTFNTASTSSTDTKAVTAKCCTGLGVTANVLVVAVTDVSSDPSVCVGCDITFTAITTPADNEDLVSWSGGGTPATEVGKTFTTQWADAGNKTVKAKCGTSEVPRSVDVVDVGKLQYETGAGQYADVPATLRVCVGSSVTFKAVITPEGASWPSGQPMWSGEASGTGETATVAFNTASTSSTDTKAVTAKCCTGEGIKADVLVVEADKIVVAGTDTADSATITLGESICLEAVSSPADSWPDGQPDWSVEKPEDSELTDPADGVATTGDITPDVEGEYVFTASCGCGTCEEASSATFTLTVVPAEESQTIPVNDDFDEGNKDTEGGPLPDNKADATAGHRAVSLDKELRGYPLVAAEGSGTFMLRVSQSGQVIVWKEEGGAFEQADAKIYGEGWEVTSGELEGVQLWLEGIAPSTTAGDVTVYSRFTPDDGSDATERTVSVTVVQVDGKVDSDNDCGIDEHDDNIEALIAPGKVLQANNGDADGDDVPDFADGFDWDGIEGTADDLISGGARPFYQMTVTLSDAIVPSDAKVKFNYSDSDPAQVTRTEDEEGGYTYTPAPGLLRLWLKDVDAARNKKSVSQPAGGDYVKSAEVFAFDKLPGTGNTRTVYIEGIRPGASSIVVTAIISEAQDTPCPDTLKVSVTSGPDLQVTGVAEEDEETKGAFIRVNDDYDEGNKDAQGDPVTDNQPDADVGDRIVDGDDELVSATLTLPAMGSDGKWTITFKDKATGLTTDRIKVWKVEDDETFTEITSGQQSADVTPPLTINLLIEGIGGSQDLRDVVLSASFTATTGCGLSGTDTVLLTIEQVDLLADSDNNGGIEEHDNNIEDDPRPEMPGKVVERNDEDVDYDGIPDFADGFDWDGESGSDFEKADDRIDSGSPSFYPMIVKLPTCIDPSEAKIKFTYSASKPEDLTRTGSEEEGYTYTPAPGKLRFWLKDAGQVRDKHSVAAGGDYLPSGVEFAFNKLPKLPADPSGVYRVYVEGTGTFQDRIVVDVNPDGDAPEDFRLTDALRISVVQMEFVIPDETYNNGENPNAAPVATDFVGVSDPRPTVELEELSSSDVNIDTDAGRATVALKCKEVRDPIADNIPAGGGADIEHVNVYVDGEQQGDSVPVTRLPEGQAGPGGFWKQHPYKGMFDSISVTIPLEEGTHVIRVETSENAAGNTGFDEVAVTIEKREVPGTGSSGGDAWGTTATLNIYLPQDLSPDVVDTVQYYRGMRDPVPEDPVLTEQQEKGKGKGKPPTFAGVVNGLPVEVTLNGFHGLTDKVDTFTARLVYTLEGVQVTHVLQFEETGEATRLFRTDFRDPSPETLEANLYIPKNLMGVAVDRLQFYYGPRRALPEDNILSEATDAPDSLTFSGTFADVETTVAITEVLVEDLEHPGQFIWVKPNAGSVAFSAARADQLRAAVLYAFDDGGTVSLRATFGETGDATGIFQAVLDVFGGVGEQPLFFWTSRTQRRPGPTGDFVPVCVRVRGLPDSVCTGSYKLHIQGPCFHLERLGDWYYLKGMSLYYLNVRKSPETGKYEVYVWDSDLPGQAPLWKPLTNQEAVAVELFNWTTEQVTVVGQREAAIAIVDLATEIDGKESPYDYDDDECEQNPGALVVWNDDFDSYTIDHGKTLQDWNYNSLRCDTENDLKPVYVKVSGAVLARTGRLWMQVLGGTRIRLMKKVQEGGLQCYKETSFDDLNWALPRQREEVENLVLYVEGKAPAEGWGDASVILHYTQLPEAKEFVKIDKIKFTVVDLKMDYHVGWQEVKVLSRADGRGMFPVNAVYNPAVIVREASPDDGNVARLRVSTQAVRSEERKPVPVAEDDGDEIRWMIDSGPIAFYEIPKGAQRVPDCTGRQARLYGRGAGGPEATLGIWLRGAEAPFFRYHCLVDSVREYPCRITILSDNASLPTAKFVRDRMVRAFDFANVYFRQVGIKIVPDEDPTIGDTKGLPERYFHRYFDQNPDLKGFWGVERVRPDHVYPADVAYETGEYNALGGRICIAMVPRFDRSVKDQKGQAVWWPNNIKSPRLENETNEGGFPDDMVMFNSPIAWGTPPRTHKYMAAVVSFSTAFTGELSFGGAVVAHEMGHCFALRHRWKEKDEDGNPGEDADSVAVYGRYQLPCPCACPDDGKWNHKDVQGNEDMENLMLVGLYLAADRHKCELDLLQAKGMHGVPRDPTQWQDH